jgi:hypothetical protein
MDIIVRGGLGIVDPNQLLALPPRQQSWVWRGPEPVSANIGDRVYFVGEGGKIYLYATYGGYGQRTANNLEGKLQSGGAILLTQPVRCIDPPVTIPGPWPPGRWLWKYDDCNLRQLIP